MGYASSLLASGWYGVVFVAICLGGCVLIGVGQIILGVRGLRRTRDLSYGVLTQREPRYMIDMTGGRHLDAETGSALFDIDRRMDASARVGRGTGLLAGALGAFVWASLVPMWTATIMVVMFALLILPYAGATTGSSVGLALSNRRFRSAPAPMRAPTRDYRVVRWLLIGLLAGSALLTPLAASTLVPRYDPSEQLRMPVAYAWVLWLAPALMALVLLVAEGSIALLWHLPMYPEMRDNEARAQFAEARARRLVNSRYRFGFGMQKMLALGQAIALMQIFIVTGVLGCVGGMLLFFAGWACAMLDVRPNANGRYTLTFFDGLFHISRRGANAHRTLPH